MFKIKSAVCDHCQNGERVAILEVAEIRKLCFPCIFYLVGLGYSVENGKYNTCKHGKLANDCDVWGCGYLQTIRRKKK